MTHPLPTQEDLRGNADPLLIVLAERILEFRGHHLHENSAYFEAITNGQRPLAVVSQCIDGRQPVHTITGLPLGKLIAQSSMAGFLGDFPDSPAAWASILFSIKELGAPVIIKLGHTGCGGANKLMELCANPAAPGEKSDPMVEWLQAAMPLAREVFEKYPELPYADKVNVLEKELVRDGVRKMERFISLMMSEGHLTEAQRPVIVGLLFDMQAVRLLHLQDGGDFTLLSKSKASLIEVDL